MSRLRIIASGDNPQTEAQIRGKLFEKLMAVVLRHFGYEIGESPSVSYAGMEIDIEGALLSTGTPLYAECKCYETPVDAPKLHAFYGKYMSRHRKDPRCHGIFIALPGVTSPAMGFYQENCASDNTITFRLYQEDEVLEAIFASETSVRPEVISAKIGDSEGEIGEWTLLYTEKGGFWIQLLVAQNGAIPTRAALFTWTGHPVSDTVTIEYLTNVHPEIKDYEVIYKESERAVAPTISDIEAEEIVEVRGSSSCFEYQFPASPAHFIGRQAALEDIDRFAEQVTSRSTTSRGLLIEAQSGWGKSSLVLAAVEQLIQKGHFAVAIDSRSASSSHFSLRVIEYVRSKLRVQGEERDMATTETRILGFDTGLRALEACARHLESEGKLLFVFLDQFENVFSLREALRRIRDLLLKLCDLQMNAVLGFSWKTDLFGLMSEFPYELQQTIASSCKRITLNTFSEAETSAMLDELSKELKSKLRRDLAFFLGLYSQGYPWLLKKLCAHVKALRDKGFSQADVANGLLNIEELFQEDLRMLTPDQEDTLKEVARIAPVRYQDLGDEFKPEVVQSLVNIRLLVKIGNKLDVYWDIFRDYLNTGRVPGQENYILRSQAGSILRATALLAEHGKRLGREDFMQAMGGITEKSFYNVVRDLRLLKVASMESSDVVLKVELGEDEPLDVSMRKHLKERLKRNRLSAAILSSLDERQTLSIEEIALLMKSSCPYITALDETWSMYARIFADWLDIADLAIFEKRRRTLSQYDPESELRERELIFSRRRGATGVPRIQYGPVEKTAIMLVHAVATSGKIDMSILPKSTLRKAIAALEDLGFVRRKRTSIAVLHECFEFVTNEEMRLALFARAALKMPSFAAFVELMVDLVEKGEGDLKLRDLAFRLRTKLGADWTDETASTNTKIMLNWARHAGIAPGTFDRPARRVEQRDNSSSLFNASTGAN